MRCLFVYAKKIYKNSLKIVKYSRRHCEYMVKCTHPFKNRLQNTDCNGLAAEETRQLAHKKPKRKVLRKRFLKG